MSAASPSKAVTSPRRAASCGWLLACLLGAVAGASASELVLIEPGVTFRGNRGDLQRDFPFTNIQQYYGQNERPVHYSYITKPFHIGKHEVTVAEFREFVQATGNVLEWTQDYFNFTYYDRWMPKQGPNPVAVDPLNASEKDSDFNERRTLRGGSWYLGPLAARCSARNFFDAEVGAAYIGFRVVREASEEEAAKFANPHAAYLENIERLETFGATFQPINRSAQIHLPRKPLTPELARAVVAIPGLHIVRGAEARPWTQELWEIFAGADALNSFSVQGEGLGQLDLSGFARSQTEIRNLDLGSAGVTDANLAQLAELNSLNHFSLAPQPGAVSDTGMRYLAGNPRLLSLRVYGAEVSGEFLDAFETPSLQVLEVSRNRQAEASGGWTKQGSLILAKRMPRLIELSLSHQQVTDADLEPLKDLERLQSLSLEGCSNLTDAGIAALVAETGRLETLGLADTAAGPIFADEVPRLYFLKRLTLESAGLNDDSIEQISRSRSLRELRLEADEEAVAYTARALAKLWRIPNLERLHIDAPVLLDESFEDFAAAPAIRELTLPAGSLSEAFIAGVLPRLGTLERLNIRHAEEGALEVWKQKIASVRPRLKVQKR